MISAMFFAFSFVVSIFAFCFFIVSGLTNRGRMALIFLACFIVSFDALTISLFYKRNEVLRVINYTYTSDEVDGEKLPHNVMITKKHIVYNWWSFRNSVKDETILIEKIGERND